MRVILVKACSRAIIWKTPATKSFRNILRKLHAEMHQWFFYFLFLFKWEFFPHWLLLTSCTDKDLTSCYIKCGLNIKAYLLCLFLRHKELGQALECPEYLESGGIRKGCKFPDESLPLFTDINFCLNGTSSEGPLKPTFTSLQIQNHGKYNSRSHVLNLTFNLAELCVIGLNSLHAVTAIDFFFDLNAFTVKCAATDTPTLNPGQDTLEIQWKNPKGKVPGHCLEYEVEHNQEGPGGKQSSVWVWYKKHFITGALFSETLLWLKEMQQWGNHCRKWNNHKFEDSCRYSGESRII